MSYRSYADRRPELMITHQSGNTTFRLTGAWTRDTICSFNHEPTLRSEQSSIVLVDASRISALDVTGAGLLELLRETYAARGIVLAFTGLGERERSLMATAHARRKHRDP